MSQMVTREYIFITGPETPSLPTASTPVGANDLVSLGYLQNNYAVKATVSTAIVAHAGGGQSLATALPSYINQVATVASANDSVKLPAAVAGKEVIVINDGANSLRVFPQTGEQTDSLGVNNGYDISTDTKNARFICAVTGTWKSAAGGGGGGGVAFAYGSEGTPRNIVIATGIVSASSHMSPSKTDQVIFVKGSVAGENTITANPQIEAHTLVGSKLMLFGITTADPVILNDGNGLRLNGPWTGYTGNALFLVWTGSVWQEVGRV